jgi:hypothetical protein
MAHATIVNGRVTVNGKPAVIPSGAEVWLRNRREGTIAFIADQDVSFGEAIKNGEALTRTGYRRVVIDQQGKLTPIVRMSTVGYMPDRGSYQLRRGDDIVLIIRWGHGADPETVFEQTPNGDIPYDHRITLSNHIDLWLQPAERGASFLTMENE